MAMITDIYSCLIDYGWKSHDRRKILYKQINNEIVILEYEENVFLAYVDNKMKYSLAVKLNSTDLSANDYADIIDNGVHEHVQC